jgi:hypothetical protein
MNYIVDVRPIPEDAPKSKLDLDLPIVEMMHAVKFSKWTDLSVPLELKNAFAHKKNLYFLFSP